MNMSREPGEHPGFEGERDRERRSISVTISPNELDCLIEVLDRELKSLVTELDRRQEQAEWRRLNEQWLLARDLVDKLRALHA